MEKINVSPAYTWHVSTGQDIGAVLQMVDDKQAYTLTDQSTFLSYQDKTQLVILSEGGNSLLNPYHIIAVNPKGHTHFNYEPANKYIDYVTGAEGQAIIANYKKDGQQLFYPDAIK